ncbi:elongin-B-like isoform X1 [Pomacea canaliculata]|uniref:elongin-B-like isoform X1 n=1 Tax=Pomacea canaliculata TaxID=400727 RepID=UPI000D72D57F|nr:elongin-B-like isoform X1 [Pomacea canaliculata]
MDVFLMIRRKKSTIFTDAKESTPLIELKRIIEGILKVPPDNQRLFKDDQAMTDDNRTLGDYGFTSAIARAQAPASIGLVYRKEGEIEADNPDGEWEPLEISPLSNPPELPDVMKPQDPTTSHTSEQPAA